jgi:DegV family protein with EDD domain
MPVRVVTDSTADLTPTEAEAHGVTVVPLNVLFGQESLRDGVDIRSDEFVQRLSTSKLLPKTSQPSVGAFAQIYERLTAGGDQVLSIHISSKLSGTLNSARTARDSLANPSSVMLLDSGSVSAELGFAVLAAAEAVERGAGIEQARAAAESALRRSRLYVVLDTLEYLQRGGRIGRARAWIGGVLNVKPVLTVREGEVAPLERVRSRERALERLAELVLRHQNAEAVAVFHAGAEQASEQLQARVSTALPDARIWPGWLGPVVGVYAGPGALGAVVLDRDSST